MSSVAGKNKSIAVEFFQMLVNERQPRKAFEKFAGPTYVQHNAHVEDGIEGAMKALVPLMENNGQIHMEIKRVLCDADLVALHHHLKLKPEDLGMSIVEFFRFEDGRIVEHWDVLMDVPGESHNCNTVF